jgi:FtsP/CotA-like multicopper oxidase with cupredoxin domain
MKTDRAKFWSGLLGCIGLVGLGVIWSTGLAGAQPGASDPHPCTPYSEINPTRREAWIKGLIDRFGYADFYEPPVVRPTSANAQYELVVQYTTGRKLAGCEIELRSYNGNLVGSTIRAKPGDTIYIRLTNRLPAGVSHGHPQDPHPPEHGGRFSFNITNLHTHGLHTSPSGDGDNVFLEIHPERYPGDPRGTQLYRIHVHDKHPAGTFWYHAHYHGSTGVQVSSGMAGALIIEGGQDANGGLDSVPEIQVAEQKVFVLQQIRYGPGGKLENFEQAIPSRRWSRNITVNGVFVPTVRMRPGEVQRWRFIHAGVEDNIALNLDGHQLHEIAADGVALGRRVAWPAAEATDGVRSLLLGPGYRTDVLVKAAPLGSGETSREYFLRDEKLPAFLSLQAVTSAIDIQRSGARLTATELITALDGKPERVIARIVVEGQPKDMALPSSEMLHNRVPSELTTIMESELTGVAQEVRFDAVSLRSCTPDGNCSTVCQDEAPDCKPRFTVNEHVFMPHQAPRLLKLGQASRWTLVGEGMFTHPFHIHVNPFEVVRQEPGPEGRMRPAKVWKDTILIPSGSPLSIKSRYTKFEGEFVIHCHILGHEDQGMMERVKISK